MLMNICLISPEANHGILQLFSHLIRLKTDELRLMLCFCVVV